MPDMKILRISIPLILALLTSCALPTVQSGVNVTSYGIKGDAITHADGVATAGSAVFTSASAAFSPVDRGKFIQITGAGSNSGMLHGSGTAHGNLATTIRLVWNSTTVVLATEATSSGTNLNFVYGTDNTAAFQAAYNAGQPIFLPTGSYLIVAGTQASPATITGTIPLLLSGAGPDSKLLSDNPIFYLTTGTSGSYVTNLDLEPITKFTVVPVAGKPPYPGTPVLVDVFGTGKGIEPPAINFNAKYPAFFSGLSAFQQEELLGPAITIQGGSEISISNITGNQVTIRLADVTSSTLQNNVFTGGYGGNADESTGGIEGCLGIATLSSFGMYTDLNDTITGNKISYCSFSNIFWGNADNLVVSNNISEYSGESGFKNFQQSSNYPSHYISVSDNIAQYSVFDGFDLSADFPHQATFPMYSTAMGNLSHNNQDTGFYSDGTNWNFTANTASSNGVEGFYLDYSDSLISGNVSLNNNLSSLTSPNLHDQVVIGGCCPTSSNLIENNFITITLPGISGDAMWVGSTNSSANNNVVQELAAEGGLYFNAPLLSSSGNTTCISSTCSVGPTTPSGNVTINGNLGITGSFSATRRNLKIDDLLDPANKFLYHNSVESPEMLNMYNGIARLNSRGRAQVMLPEYFGALNEHFRYQLTSIGKFAPVYVARGIKNNKFVIADGLPGTRVSGRRRLTGHSS